MLQIPTVSERERTPAFRCQQPEQLAERQEQASHRAGQKSHWRLQSPPEAVWEPHRSTASRPSQSTSNSRHRDSSVGFVPHTAKPTTRESPWQEAGACVQLRDMGWSGCRSVIGVRIAGALCAFTVTAGNSSLYRALVETETQPMCVSRFRKHRLLERCVD